eukprot:jgi/Botrbrau1/20471/Bobra.145_2s0032.1
MSLLRFLGRNLSPIVVNFGRSLTSTPISRGIEDFFDTPLKDGERRTAGRAWNAADLRLKSWDDLHKLWYVLLKERNMLYSEKELARHNRERFQNPTRLVKVRKSMARIKRVMHERALAHEDPVKGQALKNFLDAL